MAVTVTTTTLSNRARYLNVSGSTANADAKTVILAMANALIALGWSRYDTAGATEVVGSADNAGVILRRACYDNASSSHYNYLGLRLVGTSTNTYTFHLIQAADWTGTTVMANFVSAANLGTAYYSPNTTGNTRFLNFSQGGTIWLFDGGKTLLITSQSGSSLTKSVEQMWIVGEYKKEFGENVNTATAYIHNGVFTNDRAFLDGAGITPSSSFTYPDLLTSITGAGSSGGTGYNWGRKNPNSNSISSGASGGSQQSGMTIRTGTGVTLPQFGLTEAPTITAAGGTQNSVTSNRSAIAPVAVDFGFTTRMMMGWLGYIGHVNEFYATSIKAEFLGTPNGVAFNAYTPETLPLNSGQNRVQNAVGTGSYSYAYPTESFETPWFGSILFSGRGSYNYPLIHSSSFQEYSPATTPTNLLFTVYEPTLSCGTSNGVQNTSHGYSGTTLSYSGPQYKFSMLGRIFNLKLFGPFSSEKYIFLDSMTIPVDADGFFAAGGTNTDFWILPTGGNNMAFLMPK